jgi:hypothetical protein
MHRRTGHQQIQRVQTRLDAVRDQPGRLGCDFGAPCQRAGLAAAISRSPVFLI